VNRTICIGDVHGCLEELQSLIASLKLRPGDRLIFVGDLVDRGPDSIGVIRYVKALMANHPGSFCVAGNHESKVIEQRRKGIFKEEWTPDATADDWKFLESLPLVKKLPDLNVVVVHGGFFPKFFQSYPEGLSRIEDNWHQSKGKYMDRAKRFLRVRYVNPDGNMVSLGQETDQDVFWTEWYDGQEGYAFYGHQPYINPPEPHLSKHAAGIDTGCVFGGRLTAAVVMDDPRKAEFVSVPAVKVHAQPRFGVPGGDPFGAPDE
jgi:hypothetical protein